MGIHGVPYKHCTKRIKWTPFASQKTAAENFILPPMGFRISVVIALSPSYRKTMTAELPTSGQRLPNPHQKSYATAISTIANEPFDYRRQVL